MIRIIVVDDEFPTRQELTSLLLNIKDVEVVAECSLGQEALDFLHSDTADLIYLDIEMPQINGIETVHPGTDSCVNHALQKFTETAFQKKICIGILKISNLA